MISKTGLHAVKALAVLATLPEGQHMGAAAIAEQIGAPRNYLGKLLQSMAREGLVEGLKGLNGGFRLAQEAGKISLMDIVDRIDQVSRWNGCFLGRSACNCEEPCAIHDRWASVRNEYLRFLEQTKLQDLIDD